MVDTSLQTPSLNQVIISLDGTIILSGTSGFQNPLPGASLIVQCVATEESDWTDFVFHGTIANASTAAAPLVNPPVLLTSVIFSAIPTGNLIAQSVSYVQQNDCRFPSVTNPTGVQFAGDGNFYISIWAQSEVNRAPLIYAPTPQSNLFSSPTVPLCFVPTVTIQPGASFDFAITIRVSQDNNFSTLLSGWKACLPAMQYTPDSRPAILAYLSDPNSITPVNPHGYSNDRDFTSLAAVQSYLGFQIAFAKQINAQGIYFIGAGGADNESPFQPEDFLSNLQRVPAPIWSYIVSQMKAANLTVGMGARLEHPDYIQQLQGAINMGVGGFYLDSTGVDFESVQKLIAARKAIGGCLGYVEHPSDLSSRFFGAFGGWTAAGCFSQLSTLNKSIILWLSPGMKILTKDETAKLPLAAYAPLGAVPFWSDVYGWPANAMPQ